MVAFVMRTTMVTVQPPRRHSALPAQSRLSWQGGGCRALAGDRASWRALEWRVLRAPGGPAGWGSLHCRCSFSSLCHLGSNLSEMELARLGWLVSAGHVTMATVTPAEGGGQSSGSGSTWPRPQRARDTCTVTAVDSSVGTAPRRACSGSVCARGRHPEAW